MTPLRWLRFAIYTSSAVQVRPVILTHEPIVFFHPIMLPSMYECAFTLVPARIVEF